MRSLDVVVPVYNESEVIEEVVLGIYRDIIRKYPGSTLIVAEDGSTDGTKEKLRSLSKKIKMRLVMSDERKGYMKALKDAIMLSKSDIVFFCDSDNTHDPKDFWHLEKYIDRYDIVSGVKRNRHDPFYRVVLSVAYNSLLSMVFLINARDTNSGFKLIRKGVVKEIAPQIKYLKFGFSSELILRACKSGRKVGYVAITHRARKSGHATQFPIKKMPSVVMKQIMGIARIWLEVVWR